MPWYITKEIVADAIVAIIADGTQDISNKEETTIIVRYLEQSHNPDEPPKAVERLFKVFTLHTTSGTDFKAALWGLSMTTKFHLKI